MKRLPSFAGAPSGWTTEYNEPPGDLRATYPGHDLYQERVGDYVYAAASNTYGVGMWASAVKYDWLTPFMLASASAPQQLRYGGTQQIDGDYRFRERGIALLDNAQRARRALTLAKELGV